MPSSTTFVSIVFRFSAVLGVLQDFEKKSFATMGVKKKFGTRLQKTVNHTEMAHTSKIFS